MENEVGIVFSGESVSVREGLDIVEARQYEARVDRDLLILQQENQFVAIETHSYERWDEFRLGQEITHQKQNGIQITGKLFRLVDHTDENDRVFFDIYDKVEASRLAHGQIASISVDGIEIPALMFPVSIGDDTISFYEADGIRIRFPNQEEFNLFVPDSLRDDLARVGDFLNIQIQGEDPVVVEVVSFDKADQVVEPVVVMVNDEEFSTEWIELEADVDLTSLESPRPFMDVAIVSHSGRFFQLPVSSQLDDLVAGDSLMVKVYANSFQRVHQSEEWIEVEIVQFQDFQEQEKLVLSEPIDFQFLETDGSQVSMDENQGMMALHDQIQGKRIFELGKEFHRRSFERELKRLERCMKSSLYHYSVDIEWGEEPNEFYLKVIAVLPPTDTKVFLQLDPNVSRDWVLENVTEDEWTSMSADLEAEIEIPVTIKNFKRSEKRIEKYFRQNKDWDVLALQSKFAADGSLILMPYLTPQPQELVAEFVLESGDTIRFSESQFQGQVSAVEERDVKKRLFRFFDSVSETLAVEGNGLFVEYDGQLRPYIPDLRKVEDEWMMVAPHVNGELLPIQVRSLPNEIELEAEISPSNSRLNRFFGGNRTKNKSHYTSEELQDGIKKLTDWYTKQGYQLVNGRLELEVVDGKVQISASVYRARSEIQFHFHDDRYAEKRSKHEHWIRNEFRQEAGEAFDFAEFNNALHEVHERFHYVPIPHPVFDNETGTVQMTVEFVLQEDMRRILKGAYLDGGFSSSSQAVLSAGLDVNTHNGVKINSKLTTAPMIPSVSASIAASGPRFEDGTRVSGSVGGIWYPDEYGSFSLGAMASTPIGQSDWSVNYGGSISGIYGDIDLGGINALYLKPDLGLSYQKNGFAFSVTAGPRVSTEGAVFGELSVGVSKRMDLTENGRLYAELYAKAGVMFGSVPTAATYSSVPVQLHGVFLQPPLFVPFYAVAGANVMFELIPGILDVGVGAKAGFVGGTFSIGAGILLRLKFPLYISVMIGPAIVNGVPTPVTVSLQ